jgi:hypothetical protein
LDWENLYVGGRNLMICGGLIIQVHNGFNPYGVSVNRIDIIIRSNSGGNWPGVEYWWKVMA